MDGTMRERMARIVAKGVRGYGRQRQPEPISMDYDIADAVLDAMCEPDEAMIEAGAVAASSNDVDFRVDDVIPYDQCDNCFRAEWRGEAKAAWTAMIDAARTPAKES